MTLCQAALICMGSSVRTQEVRKHQSKELSDNKLTNGQ